MRLGLMTAAVMMVALPSLARADASIAGQWIADMGHGVQIEMDIIADGNWWSETIQDEKVVAQLAGTYEQKKTNDASGTIVFTPLKSKVSEEHGPAKVENDTYTLKENGTTLQLMVGSETMVFKQQPFAKD